MRLLVVSWLADSDRPVPWTPSSAPAWRPQLLDEAVRTQAAQALSPTGTSAQWTLLMHAWRAGWHEHAWDPWRATRWLDHQSLVLPLEVRDALHLRGETVWRETHAVMEKDWVRRQALRPQQRMGGPLTLVVRGETVKGRVVTIDAERGYYGVRVAAWCEAIPETLGHVGVQVPWELVDDLTRTPWSLSPQ